jgi:hypothetical protein
MKHLKAVSTVDLLAGMLLVSAVKQALNRPEALLRYKI